MPEENLCEMQSHFAVNHSIFKNIKTQCLIGLRPFGVSILYMGWDRHYGFQLYQSDPSGNYSGWKATCIGNNSVVGIHWIFVLLFCQHNIRLKSRWTLKLYLVCCIFLKAFTGSIEILYVHMTQEQTLKYFAF